MASNSRESRIIAAVGCPTCKAAIGAPCGNPHLHQTWRGPEDHRAQPMRCHPERREAWQGWKREHGGLADG